MNDFRSWMETTHPEICTENWFRNLATAGMIGAGALGLTGCGNGGKCPVPPLAHQTMTVARPDTQTWVYTFRGQDAKSAAKDAQSYTAEELRNRGVSDWYCGISAKVQQSGDKVSVTVTWTPREKRPIEDGSLRVSPGAGRYFRHEKMTTPGAAEFLQR